MLSICSTIKCNQVYLLLASRLKQETETLAFSRLQPAGVMMNVLAMPIVAAILSFLASRPLAIADSPPSTAHV